MSIQFQLPPELRARYLMFLQESPAHAICCTGDRHLAALANLAEECPESAPWPSLYMSVYCYHAGHRGTGVQEALRLVLYLLLCLETNGSHLIWLPLGTSWGAWGLGSYWSQ